MQVQNLLLICIAVACIVSTVFAETQPDQRQTPKSRCNTKCALCQSVNQMKVLQLCSANQLTPCGCPQFEIENKTRHLHPTPSTNNNCDRDPAAAVAGFCPYGQTKDPRTNCPTEFCSAPAKCPQDWQQRCPASLWCPTGHAIDSNGCPLCRCACNDRLHTVAGCSATCSKRGFEFEVAAPLTEGDCYSCICKDTSSSSLSRQSGGSSSSSSSSSSSKKQQKENDEEGGECKRSCSTSCGPYGFVNDTADANGCIANCSCKCPSIRDPTMCPADCPVAWSRDAYGCERCSCQQSRCPTPPKCPTNCGPYGFKVTNGCRTDCKCACPPTQCPKGCQQYSWAKDSYGCTTCKCSRQQQQQQQQCPTLSCPSCGSHGYKKDTKGCNTCSCKCPSHDSHCPSSSCLKWARDSFGCTVCSICKAAKPCIRNLTQGVGDLCTTECRNYHLQKDDDGCYRCSCEDKCPPEPKCFMGCGSYQRKRDENGCISNCDCECPKMEMATCKSSCRYNASLVKDLYGCPMCKCEKPKCKYDFQCTNNCGNYGYEADDAGCRKSCNCNCPPRKCNCANGRCNCLYGFQLDQFGCTTCQCREFSLDVFKNFANGLF